MINTADKKRFDVEKEAIKILRVAAFCFSIISWLATSEGLANYVFSNDWRVYVISFAIQSILFIFNLQLPTYWKRLQLKKLKVFFVFLYILFLLASSIFSFVYICTNAVYKHRIGYTDTSIILTSEYKEIWNQTDKYIDEYKKYLLLKASSLLEDYTEISDDESDSGYSLSELQAIEREAEKKYSDAQVNYNNEADYLANAEKKRDALYDVRYARRKEFQQAEDAVSQQLIITNEAKSVMNSLEQEYKDAQLAVLNYQPSKEILTQELLVEILSDKPDPIVLSQEMDALNEAVFNLGKSDNYVSTFNHMVEQTKALNMTISQYLILVEIEENEYGLTNSHASVPDPNSKTFESDYELWCSEWSERLDLLETTINTLPVYESRNENDTISSVVNITLLNEYDPKALNVKIDRDVRYYLSDMNDIEKSFYLFLTKYKFTPIFSAALAVFFDLASLAVGLFIHQIKQNNSVSSQHDS